MRRTRLPEDADTLLAFADAIVKVLVGRREELGIDLEIEALLRTCQCDFGELRWTPLFGQKNGWIKMEPLSC